MRKLYASNEKTPFQKKSEKVIFFHLLFWFLVIKNFGLAKAWIKIRKSGYFLLLAVELTFFKYVVAAIADPDGLPLPVAQRGLVVRALRADHLPCNQSTHLFFIFKKTKIEHIWYCPYTRTALNYFFSSSVNRQTYCTVALWTEAVN